MKLSLLSHPAEGCFKEKKLIDHLLNVGKNVTNDIKGKKLSLKLIEKGQLQRLGLIVGLMHDFGKATTFFQKYIRGNVNRSQLTNHSLISAIACYYVVKDEFQDDLCELWAYTAFHVIYRHHGNLTSFNMLGENLSYGAFDDQFQNIIECYLEELTDFYDQHSIDISIIKKIRRSDFKLFIEDESDELIEDFINSEDDKIEFFFIVNYLFSLLIDFDKLDAARLELDYFENNLEEPVSDVSVYLDHCRKQEPEKFDPAKPINELRNDFLSEIENNNNISHNNYFYSITAPTGIGKTFGCMAFARNLKEKLQKGSGRIIYCLPYTSIIDQNYLEFERIINYSNKDYQKRPNRYLLKHHCLTEKRIINRKGDEEYQFKDYLDDRLLVESWQSSMIVTTFVQFFHTLIGNSNRFLKKFHNIINSIIILDEVQNIDPDYYKLLRRTFNIIGKRFNTYFVLVTATQPVIFDKNEIISVVDHEKYMTSSVFNRVRLTIKPDISTLEEFGDHFVNSFKGQNCLIVMNTKRYAQTTYNLLKSHFPNYKIYCLTTKLTPWDRKKHISKIREHLENKIKVIVVSTQLIEAGVDLSFKMVYRDFGPMDSIVQVAGRCNRHGEYGNLGGEMVLLNLNNHRIYKPTLMQYVNQSIKKEHYESKDFFELSKDFFNQFNFTFRSEEFLSAIYNLNYDKEIEDQIPVSLFSLIEASLTKTLFILRTSNAQKDMVTLLEYLKELKTPKLTKERKYIILFEIEKLKYHLNQFSISVYENEILNFKSIIEPYDIGDGNKDFPYRYISYENQTKYAYDDKLGLCQEPKNQLPDSITF